MQIRGSRAFPNPLGIPFARLKLKAWYLKCPDNHINIEAMKSAELLNDKAFGFLF